MKQLNYPSMRFLRMAGLSLAMGLATLASAQETSYDVRHLANEQNIVSLSAAKKYLLLPVEDNAPEGKVYIIVDNNRQGEEINIRLARKQVDYYVPLDLSAFAGKAVAIDIQGTPSSAPFTTIHPPTAG